MYNHYNPILFPIFQGHYCNEINIYVLMAREYILKISFCLEIRISTKNIYIYISDIITMPSTKKIKDKNVITILKLLP